MKLIEFVPQCLKLKGLYKIIHKSLKNIQFAYNLLTVNKK